MKFDTMMRIGPLAASLVKNSI